MNELTGSTLTFIGYLVAILTIGWVAYQRTKNAADFYLGGRRLSAGVTAMSACASDMSGWLLLGVPGYAYLSGLEVGWMALGLFIGTALNWTIVAKRLRIYTFELDNALTIPTYLERRFADQSQWLRRIAAFFILLFFLFYTSSGLVAGGKLFSAVFGLPYHWAVTIGTLAIISYTFFGGFLAVSWTDLFQGLLMAAALAVVPVAILHALGGLSPFYDSLLSINPELLNVLTDKAGNKLDVITIASLMGWGLGYFGQPHILVRFKAIKSHRQIPAARRIAITWTGFTLAAAILVGLAGRAFLPSLQDDSEKIFMALVSTLFHPVTAGILLAAILSAIMSTADSQLLVASSALTEDLCPATWQEHATTKNMVRRGRFAVITIAIIALLIAFNPSSKVLDLVAYAWAGFGAAFGPVIIGSLFWRRMTRQGAFAGIMVGGMTVVIWKQISGGLFDLYELLPGFVLSWVAIVSTSVMGDPPSAKIKNYFDNVASQLKASAKIT